MRRGGQARGWMRGGARRQRAGHGSGGGGSGAQGGPEGEGQRPRGRPRPEMLRGMSALSYCQCSTGGAGCCRRTRPSHAGPCASSPWRPRGSAAPGGCAGRRRQRRRRARSATHGAGQRPWRRPATPRRSGARAVSAWHGRSARRGWTREGLCKRLCACWRQERGAYRIGGGASPFAEHGGQARR